MESQTERSRKALLVLAMTHQAIDDADKLGVADLLTPLMGACSSRVSSRRSHALLLGRPDDGLGQSLSRRVDVLCPLQTRCAIEMVHGGVICSSWVPRLREPFPVDCSASQEQSSPHHAATDHYVTSPVVRQDGRYMANRTLKVSTTA